MLVNKLLILLFVFVVGCSCNTTKKTNSEVETSEDSPSETVKTEKDGVVQGEMKDVVTNPAVVESVKIYIKESFPVQVDVYATGYLPDGCTKISDTQKALDGNTFNITIMTERPAHIVCTQALVPFDHQVELDVMGLKAGTYTVNVNGVRETFTLEVDNMLPPDK